MFNRLWGQVQLIVLAVVLSFGVLPGIAHGQDSAALDLVRSANYQYDEGEFREALRLYREAHDRLNDPRLLYRIGLSYEQIGNYQRAREYLVRYLREDADSPVKGRVEAKIGQLRSLEENIQSFLTIETDPPGAEIYLFGYMGQAEGKTPAEVPVGAGENQVTLVFPAGQRLEVLIDVGAGQREKRFFQVGTATAPPPPPREVAEQKSVPAQREERPQESVAEQVPESPGEEVASGDETQEGVAGPGDEEGLDEDEQEALAAVDDVIPMPGSEKQPLRTIQLTRVNIGPPWWAKALGVTTIIAGNAWIVLVGICIVTDCLDGEQGSYAVSLGAGALAVGGGIYLLGRNWRSRLPRLHELDFVPEGVTPPQSTAERALILKWGARF